MTYNRNIFLFFAFLLLFLPVLSACSETSPSFGRYHRGKTLDVNVVTLERVPELRYSTVDTQQVKRHYRIAPSSEDLELVMLRVKVENHTATSAVVSIDTQAAELRGLHKQTTERLSARPLDFAERTEEVPLPENPGVERVAECPQTQSRSICFLWNAKRDDGTPEAFNLRKDFGIDGWMLFEMPKDVQFQEFRWRAGDSLTIDF